MTIKQLKRPDAAIADIGKVISKDVGMATKILQLVNSAFFGLYQHIASPEQAVAILGLKTIKAKWIAIGIIYSVPVIMNAIAMGMLGWVY